MSKLLESHAARQVWVRRKTTPKNAGPQKLSAGRIILSSLLLALLLYGLVFDIVIIRGDSMYPTLKANSLALVLRSAYGIRLPFGSGQYIIRWSLPQVDDIVVLEKADSKGNGAIKRIFEIGPAYLAIEDGSLKGRGGQVSLAEHSPLRASRSLYVGRDRIFVLGDNSTASMDSRHYGSIPVTAIRGKLLLPAGSVQPLWAQRTAP